MKPIKISVVEDNNVFRTALTADIQGVFSGRELKIGSFSSGEDCLRAMEESKPDIVILDYNLNSNDPAAKNGIQVLNAIKKKYEAISVIMLTGEDKLEIAVQAFRQGASDYVVKTETQFRKINYALLNQFRIMELKYQATRYRFLVLGLVLSIAVLVGSVLAVQVFAPDLLR